MLVGCSNDNPGIALSEPPGSTEPTLATLEPSEEPTLTPPVTGGTGTYTDPYDSSTMPEDLSYINGREYFGISCSLGEPGTIIKTCQTAEYELTFSVPTIPDSLKAFAESHGNNFIQVYTESKTNGQTGAMLIFYQDSSIMGLGLGTEFNVPYMETSTIVVNNERVKDETFILDPYGKDFFEPSQDHIELVIQTVEARVN